MVEQGPASESRVLDSGGTMIIDVSGVFRGLRRLALGCALLGAAQAQAASNVTIVASGASSGGSWSGNTWTSAGPGATLLASEIEAHVAGGPTTVVTGAGGSESGDIFVNAPVSWSANALAFVALRNIEFNASLEGTGTATLLLGYGMGAVEANNTASYTFNRGASVNLPAGASLVTRLGSDGAMQAWTVITSLGAQFSTTGTDLQGMQADGYGHYALGADIDASATSGWLEPDYDGMPSYGFVPVELMTDLGAGASGAFDGLGHTISGLTIYRPTRTLIGLFSSTNGGNIVRNVGLVGGSVTGTGLAGGLAGQNLGRVSHCFNTGTVTSIIDHYAWGNLGGLLGTNAGGVSHSYATGAVRGHAGVGGLVGNNLLGTISDSHATGAVTGVAMLDLLGVPMTTEPHEIGGLAGANSGDISNSYATGAVSASIDHSTGNHVLNVGGLVGYHRGSTYVSNSSDIFIGRITDSYATGSVGGVNPINGLVCYRCDNVGGLIGTNHAGDVNNVYAIGPVTGNDRVGGLVGNNTWALMDRTFAPDYNRGGTIANAYAVGWVSAGMLHAGGLVGYNESTGQSDEVKSSVTLSYWDVGTTGKGPTEGSGYNGFGFQESIFVATGITAGFEQASYPDFNFANTWWMVDGQSRPFLRSEWSTLVTNAHQVQLMGMNLSAGYWLENDISAAETAGGMWGGGYFAPVGDNSSGAADTQFTGRLDGLGHAINNLYINRPGADDQGLFGALGPGAVVRDVNLVGHDMTGQNAVGAVAGRNAGATISRVGVQGLVKGASQVGGMVGRNEGPIANSAAMGFVTGGVAYVGSSIGGLVGENASGGSIVESFARGGAGNYLAAVDDVGGLAGTNDGAIIRSFAVNSKDVSIFATDSVVSFGGNNVGGLVGTNGGTIADSYASAEVRQGYTMGGMVGRNLGDITHGYSDGYCAVEFVPCAMVGLNDGMVSDSFWAFNVVWASGGTASGSGVFDAVYLTQAEAVSQAAILVEAPTWDFTTTWRIYEGHTRPLLRSFLKPLTATVGGVIKVYDKQPVTAAMAGVSYSPPSPNMADIFNADTPYGGAVNVGTYTPDLYSHQLGYDISYAGTGSLTITPASLAVTVADVTKVYDGTVGAAGTAVAIGTLHGTDTLSGGSFAFAHRNAGTEKTVFVSGVTVNDGNAGNNYLLSYVANTHSTILPAPLTISTYPVIKTYDGTTDAAGSAAVTSGALMAPDSISGGTFAFADPDAGSDKTVFVSGVTVSDGNGGSNYAVTYADNTSSTIFPAALTVTANDASKTYDGIPYSGGNGVTYSGFVNGETPAVLGGALSYGGSSQGAVDPGDYSIVPGGLTSTNYNITFTPGTLVISPCPAPPTPTISADTNGTGTQDQACPEQPLTLHANGATGATSYQWYKDVDLLAGETGPAYQATGAGTYTVVAFDGTCPTPHSAGYVVQDPTPQKANLSLPFGGHPIICPNGSVTIWSDSATGIQWYQDGVLIPGANSESYVATEPGSYTAVLNALGCHSQASDPFVVRILGDLDGNGAVNAVDLVILQAFRLGNAAPGTAPFTVPEPLVADFDRTGTVDDADVTALESYLTSLSCTP